MRTTQKTTCPLPGLEGVEVEYNMMASLAALEDFMRTMGRERWDDLIVAIDGWDNKQYPGGPQSDEAPLAWRFWVARQGVQAASIAYVTDPN